LVDDGIAAEDGGLVSYRNVSTPRIDSVSVASGTRSGGEALYIFGSALDVGALVVRFGGVPVQAVTNRTTTQARVVTPIGRFVFQAMRPLYRLRLTNTVGTITVGQTIRTTNGSLATVRFFEGPTSFQVQFTSLTGTATALAGQVASTPTGSGPIATVTTSPLITGEGLTGLQSGARGAFIAPSAVIAPVGNFLANETVRGDASGSCAALGTPAVSGLVDVTVENEYGRRHTGGTLVGGFTYS
jgi:hypothetical protein